MRRFRWPAIGVLLLGMSVLVVLIALGVPIPGLTRPTRPPEPRPVDPGDQEIAWINTPTELGTWDEFVTGVKRAEMRVPGLKVDVSAAFPDQTTAVPEIALTRPPCPGRLLIRWYKTSAGATVHDWVKALAGRSPAPLAVIGGWSSDRAVELAAVLNRQTGWHGDPPQLLVTAATIGTLLENPENPNDPEWSRRSRAERQFDRLYPDRTFRFCFTNSQMADAVTDYLAHDPTLFPGRGGWPGFAAVGVGAAGPWPATSGLADLAAIGPAVFTFQWEDDPFSEDLGFEYKNAIRTQFTPADDPLPGAPRLFDNSQEPPVNFTFKIPYSTGRFSRANPAELEAVREVFRNLPSYPERSVLVLPTGASGPARRVLLALSERVPQAGRRFVAVTGDGLSVNTVFRDAEFAWPARSIPIPLIMFAHQNPFGWDEPGTPAPPEGYALDRDSKTSTQDIRLYTEMAVILADTVFPPTGPQPGMATRANDLRERIKAHPLDLFDALGNRKDRSGDGEHVVVLRPTQRYGADPAVPRPDAVVEVYRRSSGENGWVRVTGVTVPPTASADGRTRE
jgi:hypothetical protein